jgi:hypothetical protein
MVGEFFIADGAAVEAFRSSLAWATASGFTIAEPARGRKLRMLLRRPAS